MSGCGEGGVGGGSLWIFLSQGEEFLFRRLKMVLRCIRSISMVELNRHYNLLEGEYV